MKFTFKIQKYQTEAVDALVKCFEGQQFADKVQYLRDKGIMPQVQKTEIEQGELFENESSTTDEELEQEDNGYRNADLILGDKELLENIHKIQDSNFIIHSAKIKRTAGVPSFEASLTRARTNSFVSSSLKFLSMPV